MRVAVLVLSWNAADAVVACLEALERQVMPPAYVIVVDNASVGGVADLIAQRFPQMELVRNPRNLGFAGGMNVGIRYARSLPEPPELVVLLNQDTLVDPGWLAALVRPFADPQVVAAGGKIRYPDGTLQHAGVELAWPRALAHHVGWHQPDTGQHDHERSCDFVTGAALALRLQALDPLEPLDEGYTPAYFEDLDLCWRLRRAGGRIVYTPAATLVHHESLSLRDELRRSCYYNRGRLRFVLKSYPLADLEGPFLEAEQVFLRVHAHLPEGQALRWAYAESLASVSELVAARRQIEPDLPPDTVDRFRDLLITLRRIQATTLRERAWQVVETMFA
ncbi:MAG: glycosyltransferase family 2 protein [Oscillochloridaceae bacterium umkhey_bin13]